MNKKLTVFDFLKSVTATKQQLINSENFEKEYNPFMVNRFLGGSEHTLFFANIMNQLHHLPKKLQYDFYFNGIEKKKRYLRSIKTPKKSSDIEMLIRYYECSHTQALDYEELLNEEQLGNIRKFYASRIEKGNTNENVRNKGRT